MSEKIKPKTNFDAPTTRDQTRAMFAAHAAAGLLSSQEKKGWNLGTLAVVSWRIADVLMDVGAEELPEPVTTENPTPTSDSKAPELEVVSEGDPEQS